jgi:hypothetical protein
VLEYLPAGIARRRAGASAVEPIDADHKPLFAAGIAEVQALAFDFRAFRHANVLPLLDCFGANETVYLVIDDPDGRPLDRLLEPDEALTHEEVAEILPTLLAGCEAIHRAGLLHLDICPAAVTVRADGTAALGRAHLVRRTLGAPGHGAQPKARDAFRAAEYFQPNATLGPWTDVYALCATLLRAASGAPPPDVSRRRAAGADSIDPAHAALDGLVGAWPHPFLSALRHGLELEAANRPQSIAALRGLFGASGPGEIPTLPLREAGKTGTASPPPAAAPDEAATQRVARRDPAARPRRTAPVAQAPPTQDEIPTVRFTRSAAPPIVAPAAAPAPESEDDRKTTVIYRHGRAQVVTAAPAPRETAAPATDTAPAILPARFSVFFPMTLAPGQWLDAAVYLHEPGLDSFVRRDHLSRFDGRPAEVPERRSDQRYSLKPGAAVTVAPYLPGCRINPPRATVEWWENFHRLSFRVSASPAAAGLTEGAREGAVLFFAGPLLIGEARLAFAVARKPSHPVSNTATLAADTFEAVFPGYAPQDGEIADRLGEVAAQLDNPFFAEILALRARAWDREILKRIEAAERFQLFWSSAAARSPHLEEEWRFARSLGRRRFLRAFYWRHPAPGLPEGLSDLDAEDELRFLALSLE